MGVLPRVVVDARMVGGVGHGIAHYVMDLALGLAELREAKKLTYDVVFLVHEKRRKQTNLGNFPTFHVNSPFLDMRENFEIAEVLTRLRADLYHSPSFSSPLFCPCPTIQTVHDLNHLHFGSLATKLYYHLLLKRFAQRSRHLITISDFSRQEIAAWLDIPEEQISIVKNAIRPDLLAKSAAGSVGLLREHALEDKQYFFTLASARKHKNLKRLLRAYRYYRREAGAKAWPLVLPIPHGRSLGDGVLALGPLDTANAMMLLKHSGAFFFPSLYEGFGRPPLEAACMGVPLIVSAIPSHREGLAGVPEDEYTLIAPKNVMGWRDAMLAAARGELKAPGAAAKQWIAENHSVQRMASQMNEIYVRNIRRF